MTPTIKSCIPKNREEWLALRRNYITATDLVAIRGEVSWDDPLSTLRRKLGLEPEKAEDPEAIQRLDALYNYMGNRLVEANQVNDAEMIDEVARLLITVKTGWDAIAPQ